MLKRITKWFSESREWHRQHIEAWSGWTEPSQNNLSRFQIECEAAMSNALLEVGSRFTDRVVTPLKSGDSELKVALWNTSYEVWLYSDSISSKGKGGEFWLEEWDARTPRELIDIAVSKIREVVLKNRLSAA